MHSDFQILIGDAPSEIVVKKSLSGEVDYVGWGGDPPGFSFDCVIIAALSTSNHLVTGLCNAFGSCRLK